MGGKLKDLQKRLDKILSVSSNLNDGPLSICNVSFNSTNKLSIKSNHFPISLHTPDLDGKVGGKLKDLQKRLEEVRKTTGVISTKADDARAIGQLAERNTTIAEDIIKRALEALNGARKFLETEGLSALEKAVERSEKFGQQSERMSEIAREARTLADE